MTLPDIKYCRQGWYIDGQLDEPPVLDILCNEGEDDDAHGPEGLDDTPGHGAVSGSEQLQDH